MLWHERLKLVRRHGPPSPTQRHLLEVLTSYDDDAGRFVWPGNERLARETGLTGRAVRANLAQLVRCGWLEPELPARESRPTAKPGHEAWWAHGNTGGRTRSTRYRIRYPTPPPGGETRKDVPQQPGTSFRSDHTGSKQTRNDVHQTRKDVPLNPEGRSGDPSTESKIHGEGLPPPPPPHPYNAVSWNPDTRHAIQAAARAAGAAIADTAELTAYEALLATIGVETSSEVPRVFFDLRHAYAAEFLKPPTTPTPARDLAPFAAAAQRGLAGRRRLFATIHKDTA